MVRSCEDRLLRVATKDCYSRKATMGKDLMAPRTDCTTHIPSSVASPVTTKYAAKGPLFVTLRKSGNFQNWYRREVADGAELRRRGHPLLWVLRLELMVWGSWFWFPGLGLRDTPLKRGDPNHVQKYPLFV